MLESNPETTRISENILHILQTVMEWDYFQFDQYCKQTDRLDMSAPTSSLLAEIYCHVYEWLYL
jgi:hypothetical protein